MRGGAPGIGVRPSLVASARQADGGDWVAVRVARDCTAQELCAWLGFSRSVTHRVFERGQLSVGEGMALSRQSGLEAGDEVRVALVATREMGETSCGPVSVLWQDRLVMAVDKPTGLLVHDDGTGADTLTARVRGNTGLPAQAVQRLDVETSGVMLFSLAEEFQPALDAQVAGHTMHKRYVAVVRGRLPEGVRMIDAGLARDRHDARRMRVGKAGKPAKTLVAPLAYGKGVTLVGCELLSGRKHQIRVHLAHVGHPLVGDALYGVGREGASAGLMLHALEETFEHPLTHERVVVRTGWPTRFCPYFAPRQVDWEALGRR